MEWHHSEQNGQVMRPFRYLGLHDAKGRALVPATVPPWKPSFPVFSDDSGYCYFLRRSSPPGSVELVKTRVSLR